MEPKSADKIISTLALHWVKSLDAAAMELRRVLMDDGSLDILMIARDDGATFKRRSSPPSANT
jgi:ubiquinone/menaquinone biosynthesis C-methylase UbiE